MRKVLNFVNDNKKIIIVVILIIILVGTIYFLNNGNKRKPTSGSSVTEQSETEVKLTAILSSIEGVGATNVMINESKEEITGVIIVCEGANSIIVRNDILNAVSTALNVEKNIIVIYSMNI